MKEDKFELVKWAVTFKFSKYVKLCLCEVAAKSGKFHLLKWARKQQPPLPWNMGTCNRAFDFGHYDILKWSIENGCPCWNQIKTDFLQYVSIFEDEKKWKNIVVNQRIYNNGEYTTLMMASNFGHLELVRHLLTCNGINVNMKWKSSHLAFTNGKEEVCDFILDHIESIEANNQG
eukprot:g3579.t1